MSSLHPSTMIKLWWFRKFHRTVRTGYYTMRSGRRHGTAIGLVMIAYGLTKGRSGRRLIYKTSIDVGEGATIRVMRGRRPIGETASIR